MANNKNCKIVTFHTPINYGAVLQATALSTYVSKYIKDTEIVDYDTKCLRKKYPLFRKSRGILSVFWFLFDLWFCGPKIIKKKRFKLFLKKHNRFTKKFKSFNAIKNASINATFLITGSDQVFRPTREYEERNVFYLDLKTGAKKISYAASFGGIEVDEDKREEITHYLSSFSALSVREKSGVDILRKIGFASQLVLDPVFLIDKSEWKSFVDNFKCPKNDYILYYALIDNPIYHKYVECLAALLKKEVVVIGNINFKPFKKCTYLRTCGPEEFIALVANAKYVFTSSFHGVAFSLIFGKQFYSIEEDPILKNRAEDLMNSLGIPYLSFYEILEKCKTGSLEYINYNSVSFKLNEKISNSKAFLKKALEIE